MVQQRRLVALTLLAAMAASGRADIYRWDNRQVIPGTEGITPGPSVILDHHELSYALLSNLDLTDSRFEFSNMTYAWLYLSTLTQANLTGANLTSANLYSSTLTQANLTGTNLTNANLYSSWLTQTNLSGAVVAGANFSGTTSRGFTKAQLASTASYQAKNLTGIQLWYNDLTGWDLSGQNLTSADLPFSTLTQGNLSGANLTSADLSNSTLTQANLTRANLTRANLYASTLTQANLSGAVVAGANFNDTTRRGFTQAQLASTTSYQAKNLTGIWLGVNDLTGWDLSGQNLTSASLTFSTLTQANLSGANLKNANLGEATAAQSAVFTPSTIYNQWTVFPAGFDPVTSGLTLMPSPLGDFDANDALDIADIDLLQFRIRNGSVNPDWLPTTMFDLNSDDAIDLEDVGVWVKDLEHTWFGDANLDLEFNSTDLVEILAIGKYEVTERDWNGNIVNPAGWAEGDFNADGEFTSSDLVVALADGGYEQGPRPVPEPSSIALLILGVCEFLRTRCVR